MLVLSRKEGERLVIGDNITLVVSKISGNRVTIGIQAPASVKIYRGELSPNEASPERDAPKVVPIGRRGLSCDLGELKRQEELGKQAM
jgi:carbon storage regulator